MILLSLLAVVALVAVNALFVATEFALVAARPSSLEAAAAEGSGSASRALAARRDLRVQMSGAQLGITVSSIALGVLAEPTIGRHLEPLIYAAGLPSGVSSTTALVLAIGLAAVFQMLFGELVPKNFAIADPERTLRWTVRLHGAFVAVLRPGIVVVDRLAAMAVRPFGLTPVDEIRRAVGAPELTVLLEASRDDGLIERFEHDLLIGVLDLGRQTAASVMVARSSVVAVDRRLPLVEVEEVMASSGHTRLPVLDRRTAEVVGMVHAKDLLRLPPEARDEPVPLESIRSLLVLPTDLLLDDVLQGLRRSRSQMAVVVDGSGSWVGILSMDDVVEELVGEIPDESEDGAQ
jgi:CBS domain containing-hemolysin-like protein